MHGCVISVTGQNGSLSCSTQYVNKIQLLLETARYFGADQFSVLDLQAKKVSDMDRNLAHGEQSSIEFLTFNSLIDKNRNG